MTRDERQRLTIQRWIDAGGIGIVEACTGFGDTRLLNQKFIYLYIIYNIIYLYE